MTLEDQLRSHFAKLDKLPQAGAGDVDAVVARGRHLRRRRRVAQVMGGVAVIVLATLPLGSILDGGSTPSVIGAPIKAIANWELTEGNVPYAAVPDVSPLNSAGLAGPNGLTLLETQVDNRWLIGWWKERLNLVPDLKVYESEDGSSWTVTSVRIDGLDDATVYDAARFGDLSVALFRGEETEVATSFDLLRWTVEELPDIPGPAQPPPGALWTWSTPVTRLIPWGETPVISISAKPELNVAAWWESEFPGRSIPASYAVGTGESGFVVETRATTYEIPFATVFPESAPKIHNEYLVRDGGVWNQPAEAGLPLRPNTSLLWAQSGTWYSFSPATEARGPFPLHDLARWTGDDWQTVAIIDVVSFGPTSDGFWFLSSDGSGFGLSFLGHDMLVASGIGLEPPGTEGDDRRPVVVPGGEDVVVIWGRSALRPGTGAGWRDLTNPRLQRGVGDGVSGSVYRDGLLLARQDLAPDRWWVFDLRP